MIEEENMIIYVISNGNWNIYHGYWIGHHSDNSSVIIAAYIVVVGNLLSA